MDELSERMREATSSHTRRAHAARPPQGLRASIAKARMLRVGGSAAVAAVAIVGIGAAGAGFTGIGETAEPDPTASVDLSLDPGAVGYTTMPFPEDPYGSSWETARELCDQPLPQSDAPHEGFAAEFEMPAAMTIPAMGDGGLSSSELPVATLHFAGTEPVPLFVAHPQAVFLEDGIVVGIALSNSEVPVTTLQSGSQIARHWQWQGAAVTCDEEDPNGALAGGEYEMAVILHAHNDEQAAAIQSLRMDGHILPTRHEAVALSPGSYECGEEYRWGGMAPITCEPQAVPGVEIDDEAGTITLPYDTEYYTQDIDLTYVSATLPVTLEEDPSRVMAEQDDLPAFDAGTVPACGDTFSSLDTGSLHAAWDAGAPAPPDLATGDQIDTALWLYAQSWAEASIDLPRDPRLWITREEDMTQEAEDDPSVTFHYAQHRVVGWIDTTATEDGGTLDIIRYDGPAQWSLTVEDMQWCEGLEPGAGSDDGDADSGGDTALSDQYEENWYPLFIAAPTLLNLDDGTEEELDGLLFYPQRNFS